MNTLIDAAKQALEALENKRHEYRAYQAITALRQAIAQAEKQFNPDWDQQAVLVERIRELEKQNQHLIYGNDCLLKALKMVAYEVKSPRKPWVGLTVDEIVELSESEENTGDVWMALNVQARLKEKNNGN